MERSLSSEARAALDSYPWRHPSDRLKAEREAMLVAFGDQVEVDDLPLAVRQWLRRNRSDRRGYVWRGESWKALTEGFEKDILSQALAANGGNAAATARALKTTPRIVAYKARKYGLLKTRGLCYNIRHAEGNADIRPQED